MQNTISESTTRRTLKQMGSSSRRQHRLLLLLAKNRKRRLQFPQAHQNWTIEDWKNFAWSDESRFLLQHSDGRESEKKQVRKHNDISDKPEEIGIVWDSAIGLRIDYSPLTGRDICQSRCTGRTKTRTAEIINTSAPVVQMVNRVSFHLFDTIDPVSILPF